MRKTPLLALVALGGVAVAQPAARPASVPVTLAQVQVPQGSSAQLVHVHTRDFPAGIETGWHIHPGTEVAYVAAGEMSLTTPQGVRRLRAGDSFVMPRGAPHNAASVGQGTAKVVITLVIDAGAPPRQAVSPPTGGAAPR